MDTDLEDGMERLSAGNGNKKHSFTQKMPKKEGERGWQQMEREGERE